MDPLSEPASAAPEPEASVGDVQVEASGVTIVGGPIVPWREAWTVAAKTLPKLEVGVDNPSQAGTALSRFVVYRVRARLAREDGTSEEFEVSRRFSEFLALRDALVQRYVGLLVPPLPPKEMQSMATMSKVSAAVQTESRLRVLSLFAERLGSLPWVGDDAVLRAFAGASAETFDAALKDDASGDGSIATDDRAASGRGRALWYNAVARSAPALGVPALAKVIAECQGKLGDLEDGLQRAAASLEKGCAGLDARARGVGALAEGFAPWRGAAAKFATLDYERRGARGEPPATAVSTALRAWTLEASPEAASFNKAVGGAIAWQILHCDALKKLVGKRGILLDELRKEQVALQKLHAARASGRKPSEDAAPEKKGSFWNSMQKGLEAATKKAEPKLSVEEQIAKSEKVVEENERLLEQHARALVYCELARFEAEHAAFNAQWTRRFFQAQKDQASRAAAAWDDALDALGTGTSPDDDRARDDLAAAELVWDSPESSDVGRPSDGPVPV